MAQTWAPTMKNAMAQAVAQVLAQWNADKASLTDPAKTEVDIFAAFGRGHQKLKPCSLRVLPPGGGSRFTVIASTSLEGVLVLPIVVRSSGADPAKIADVHVELVGLVIDGLQSDLTLNGQVVGPAENTFTFGAVETEPGHSFVEQEILAAFVKVQ